MATKLCLIKTNKIVPELYNMSGPFYDPITLTTEQITSMLNRGVPVYEVNPYNRKEKVRLTRFMVNQVNFKKPVEKKSTTTVASASTTSAPIPEAVEAATDFQVRNNSKFQKHKGSSSREQTANPSQVKIADFR